MNRLLLITALALQASAAIAQDAFLSPAVDRQVFRDSEVRRLTGTFKDWQVSCDEIPNLKQRYCSLFSQGRSADGHTVLGMVVTTTEDGKPAAMLQLPFGIRLSSDIEIVSSPAVKVRGKTTKPTEETRLRVIACNPGSCMTLWQLTPAQIAILNGAGSLTVRLQAPRLGYVWPALPARNADRPIEVAVSSAGFKDAITATQTSVVR